VPRLKRSTWILVVGLLTAGATLGAGALTARHLETQQFKQRLACEKAGESQSAKAPTGELIPDSARPNHPTADYDPDIAAAFADEIRAKRLAACEAKLGHVPDDAEIARWQQSARVAALVIAILCTLPSAWYFLLRRIAELRAAIGGTPPAG
jgi:hypothetical protein